MAEDRKEIQAANVDLKLSRIKRLVFPMITEKNLLVICRSVSCTSIT